MRYIQDMCFFKRQVPVWLVFPLQPKAVFNPLKKAFQQISAAQVGTRLVVGKGAALIGSCRMDRTAPAQFAICEKNAGTILPNLEGVAFLYISFPHFSVAELKMSGDAVDIYGGNKEG